MTITTHTRRILLATVIVAISITIFFYKDSLFEFVKSLDQLGMDNPGLTALILIGLKTFAAPFGFPGTPLTLLSGSLLGNLWGTVVSLIGNTLGAILAFVTSRYILREYVQEKFVSKHESIKKYEERLESKAMATVIALRLIPIFPFNVLNLVLGLTNISIRDYIIGSFFGMIPGTFMFVFFGESVRMLNFLNIALAVVGILALIFLGKFYEKRF